MRRVRRFFPVMGITRVADVTGLDTIGIPVVMVCRPNSRSLAVSQGKALDPLAAKVSGVMESIEAYMAERITSPLLLASWNDLRFTHRLVDVAGLPRTTTSRYQPDLPLLWVAGEDLFDGEKTWVPYEMVHTAYTLPAPSGTGCFVGTSNGLASGNHHLEALSHAICETVERDATTLHSLLDYGSDAAAARRLDLDTVDNSECIDALSRIEAAGVAVAVWNTTTDIGIPAFKCLIVQREQNPLSPMYSSEGMGCHPTRGVALLRAITEAVQSRLTYISGARDDITRYDFALGANPQLIAIQEDLVSGRGNCDFHSIPSFESESFDADIAWELDQLQRVGISQAVVVDLTREEFDIPVIRVIVPGLEGPTERIRSCILGQRAVKLLQS
jgi:YcaO-like protein with predicted kinase domain